jgi:diguanylate cyclase (GGDEF)-like protein/PAS domain S-box-containing protein
MNELNHYRILIAEDEVIIAMDIQMRLEKAGYSVTAIATSGEQAARAAVETNPDLVLMDIGLQGHLDGIAAAAQIRQTLDIPVVYLTSFSNQAILERAKLTEAYGYLLKPFEERSLLSTIEVALYKHKIDREVRQREEQFRAIVERSFDTIVNFDLEGKITYISPAVERVTGFKPEQLVGQTIFNFVLDAEVNSVARLFARNVQGETIGAIENRLLCKDGSFIYIEANSLPILEDGEVVGIQAIFRDITERKKIELELQHMATHDYLTDLPNTRLFLEHLDKALSRAKRSNLFVALLYVDLDGFKQVNDTYGHSVGDHLLRMVADRLAGNVRKSDIVSRLGGDEFAVLMTDLQNLQSVDVLAERLQREMQAPFSVDGTITALTVSIGISTFPADTQEAATLIRNADRAMYYSKSLGKNRASHFSEKEAAAPLAKDA